MLTCASHCTTAHCGRAIITLVRPYRHATPLNLWRIFFNQDGFYHETADRIVITLKPFRDKHVQPEASQACQRFNERRITTLSGKQIEMRIAQSI